MRPILKGAALTAIPLAIAAGVLLHEALSEPAENLKTLHVGSARCGTCHTVNYPTWRRTLHATMARRATPETILGDFETRNEYRLSDGIWSDEIPTDDRILVRMERHGDEYYSFIFDPASGKMNPYRITHVIGTTYRQTYLIESDGTFFRVPIEWDVKRRIWLNLWNRQERKDETIDGPMQTLLNLSGHWDENCARCHTTGYRLEQGGSWNELGIACESCHGAGGAHAAYYQDDLRLRLRTGVLRLLSRSPKSFIVRPDRLDPARSVSVCGQCHHPDTWARSVPQIVAYEPGEDLSPHFREVPLERDAEYPPSNKTWADGSPRGPGMLFRSFIESRCFSAGGATCIDCHSPHVAGEYRDRLSAGAASDRYCLGCHERIGSDVAGHTRHKPDGEGARCYGCHMPRLLEGVTMVGKFDYARVRTHEIDHIPYPEATLQLGGLERVPNACADCHADRGAEWAVRWSREWWGPREAIAAEIAARPPAGPYSRMQRTHGL